MTDQTNLPLGEPVYFFKYDQNNSGGSFHYDENLGENVVVEAHSPGEANEIAEGLGIYFDGCSSGDDCGCCGDRWSPAGRWGGDKVEPNDWSVFATAEAAIAAHAPDPDDKLKLRLKGDQLVIHYLDGRKEWHFEDTTFKNRWSR